MEYKKPRKNAKYVREILGDYSFNFSGYNDLSSTRKGRFSDINYGTNGSCQMHNNRILDKFAHLGIYDCVDFVYLKFYKGNPEIFVKYTNVDEVFHDELGGWNTSHIIEYVFEKTIYSPLAMFRRTYND